MQNYVEDKMTPVFCDELSEHTKNAVFELIRKAEEQPNIQFNYVDPADNVSYCVSVDDHKLAVSVVDWGPLPNASLYPVLTNVYGEPAHVFSKPWVRDERFVFLVMYWEVNSVSQSFH